MQEEVTVSRKNNVVHNTCKYKTCQFNTWVVLQFEQTRYIVLISEIYRFWQVHADVIRQSFELIS